MINCTPAWELRSIWVWSHENITEHVDLDGTCGKMWKKGSKPGGDLGIPIFSNVLLLWNNLIQECPSCGGFSVSSEAHVCVLL